jgi:hypothetical protein
VQALSVHIDAAFLPHVATASAVVALQREKRRRSHLLSTVREIGGTTSVGMRDKQEEKRRRVGIRG